MNKSALLLLLFAPFLAFCQKKDRVNIVPQPVSISEKNSVFLLNADTKIIYPSSKGDWAMAADYLTGIIRPSTGFALKSEPAKGKSSAKNTIVFVEDPKMAQPEGYQLEVGKNGIVVRSKTPAGAFYAVQTIRQLFPAAINAETLQTGVEWAAQGCAIKDYPRFSYRGMHLDVGRHWFPVSFIKRYIDLLAMQKMNSFHWHLTEDQGWRIEIKRYPKLQQIAACRKQTLMGHYTDEPVKYDGTKYCHYYTQEEVKEVVEYARQHFVTVIPEIEMPGHALAALTAYPELGCIGAGYETGTKWGVYDDVFCAGNEKVYEFLDGVLAEVAALFPGQYIHIGGDECPKERWKECPKCQAAIKREGLKNEHELQSYFIGRAEKMLAKYGKKLIGWDEILEGGLAPTATVMSWRGEEGGIAAAKADHDVIMTPTTYVYLDYYQSDPETEPLAIGGLLPLEKVYSYEPIPADFTPQQAKHILGVQANIWTEYIATPEKVEYMAFPRACAVAEIAWSQKDRRSWEGFSQRLVPYFARLAAKNVNFAKSYFDVKTAFTNGKVNLTCTDPDVQIRYTTDGTDPGPGSTAYTGPFAIAKNTTVKTAAFGADLKVGKTVTVNYLIHKASGKPYTMSKAPEKFTGGEQYALTNGVTGGLKTWGAWVALVNQDLDPVIDLGASMPLNRVTTHYMNNKGSWIHPPKAIEVFVSEDGKQFFSEGRKVIDPEEKMNNSIETVTFTLKNVKGRYVKLVATTAGVIPAGYPGAGEGAWLFLDEIIVE